MINKIRLRVHDRVRSEDLKHEFVVDALIHSGTGQGDIYKVHEGKDVYALKLYHTGDPKRHRRQIDILYKRGRASSSFVHPLFTVKVGEQIGYVMEYVGGDHYKSGSVLFNGLERDADGGNTIRMELPFCQKLEILYNYLNAAAILYDADIIYGDYKPDNCKVNMNDYSVKILDTDTAVGAASRPIVCGTIGFVEPLVMRGEIVPNKHSDAFALAVIIYMTLISGHPLRGKRYEEPCNTDIDTYTFATNPIYVYSNLDHSNRPLPDDKRVIERMKAYPQYFRDAMHRTFVDGLFDGEKRTSPREWMEILTQLYRDHFISVRSISLALLPAIAMCAAPPLNPQSSWFVTMHPGVVCICSTEWIFTPRIFFLPRIITDCSESWCRSMTKNTDFFAWALVP